VLEEVSRTSPSFFHQFCNSPVLFQSFLSSVASVTA
jgi:hypothetical protein